MIHQNDMLTNEQRLVALYTELDKLLNMSPWEEDCTEEENYMYSKMAELSEAMFDAGYTKYGTFSKN